MRLALAPLTTGLKNVSRPTAHALLVTGVTLLTLTGVLVRLEPMAATLAELDPVGRLAALGPAAAIVAACALVCGGALHVAPRAVASRLLGSATLGAAAALALAISAPHWLANGASPVALLQ